MKRGILYSAVLLSVNSYALNFELQGIGGGGRIVEISPNPQSLCEWMAGGDVEGIFYTQDCGQHWEFRYGGIVDYYVHQITWDGNRLYAAAQSGPYVSLDRGMNWTSIRGAGMPTPSGGSNSAPLVALQKDSYGRLWAAEGDLMNTAGNGDVWISSDEGANWILRRGTLPSTTNRDMALDPYAPDTAYIANGQGLYKTVDAGVTWVRIFTGNVVNIEVAPSNHNVIALMLKTSSVYVSTDAGNTWAQRDSGRGVTSGTTGYALSFNPRNANELWASRFYDSYTIRRSRDLGLTWEGLLPNPSRDGVPSAFVSYDVGISAANPDYVMLGQVRWMTHDAGVTWRSVYQTEVSPGYYRHNGMMLTCHTDIAFDPLNVNHQFLAMADNGIYESYDGGYSYTSWGCEPVPSSTGVVYDTSGTVWAACSSNGAYDTTELMSRTSSTGWVSAQAGLPVGVVRADLTIDLRAPKQWVVRTGGGLYLSADGYSWSQVPGLSSLMLFHYDHESGDYYAISASVLWVSHDRGNSWVTLGNINGNKSFQMDVHAGVIVVASRNSAQFPTAIWRSDDGGMTFSSLPLPPWFKGHVSSVMIDRTDPAWLYAGSRQDRYADTLESSGLMRTHDLGATWEAISEGEMSITGMIPHPYQDSAFYVLNGCNGTVKVTQ